MTQTGDGAVVERLEDRCPICGASPRTDHCLRPVDFMLCPNDKECKNKDGEGRRVGCDGFLRGNIGFGIMLGNNILVDMRKDIRNPEDITSDTSAVWDKRIDSYKEKAVNSYMKIFSVDENASLDDSLKESVKSYQEREVSDEADDLLAQKVKKIHPLAKGGGIQAHHLISSEVMDEEQWRNLCKTVGYNINCRLNGVYLPSGMDLACTAKIPLHKGGHSAGYAGAGDTNYPKEVAKEVTNILNMLRDMNPCENPDEVADLAKNIIEALNRASETIFNNVKDFKWTITWDGFDYQLGNPIGCSNLKSIQDKQGIRKKDNKPVEYSDLEKANQQKLASQRTMRITDVELNQTKTLKDFHEMLENEEHKGLRCSCGREHNKIKNKLAKTGRYAGKYILKLGE